MSRLARLAAGLSEPLLVTDAVNVRYLTGFESSNCALLVEPDGTTTLYTDFRYLEAARAVEGSRSSRPAATSRARSPSCSPAGGSASRHRGSRYAQWETIGAGGAELVPTRGLVEALRVGQGRRRARRDPAGRRDLGRRLRGARRASGSSGAPRPRSPGGSSARSASTAPRRSPSARSSPPGENGARPHARPGRRRRSRQGTLVTVDMGCVVDGYRSDCTRTFATGRALGAARGGLRARRAGAARRPRRRARGRVRRRRRRSLADGDRRGGPRRRLRPRARPRRRARDPRGADAAARVDRRARRRQRRHRRAGPLPAGRRRLPDRGSRRRHRGRLRDPDVASRRSCSSSLDTCRAEPDNRASWPADRPPEEAHAAFARFARDCRSWRRGPARRTDRNCRGSALDRDRCGRRDRARLQLRGRDPRARVRPRPGCRPGQ